MTVNRLTYLILTLLIVLAGLYYGASTNFSETNSGTIDAGYFPRILAILLIVLCVISFISTYRESDEKIGYPNLRLILITILLTVIYFILWNLFNIVFYPLTFLFIMSLFILYKKKPIIDRGLIGILIITLSLTVIIYVVFDLGMSIRF